jgi:POT family proton-dependent oligopeptide transporter
LGSGFLKAGVPSLVGRFGETHSRGKDSLYALLYLGFNVGTLLGTLGCAVVGETFGWRYGFLVAGCAAVACAALTLRKWEFEEELRPRPALAAAATVVLVPVIAVFVARPVLLGPLLGVGVLGAILGMGLIAWRDGASARRNVALLVILMIWHTVFFALYEQGALSFILFTERHVERHGVPVTFFEALDPILNIALGGVFVWTWARLEARSRNPAAATKFSAGLMVTAMSFALVALPLVGNRVSWVWLVTAYTLLVLAEQCLIPIGFSAVHRLAPAGHRNFFLGAWFVGIGAAEWLSSSLSKLTAAAQALSGAASLAVYQNAFAQMAALAFSAAVLLVPLTIWLRRHQDERMGRGPTSYDGRSARRVSRFRSWVVHATTGKHSQPR